MMFIHLLLSQIFCFQYKGIIYKSMNQIANELTNGSLLEGRLSINDVKNLFSDLIESTAIIHDEKIGETYQGREIYSYSLCYNFTYQKPKILITSLHHSREVASLQMNIYLFLYMVKQVLENEDPFYVNMAQQNCVIIVPFVNLDGYAEIEREFPDNPMPSTRKNLNRTVKCSPEEDGGVDLNRNYGYYFAYDNEGSSNNPCNECYRGASAFSEKETQAIKHVINNFNVKMAMNLHCFGNLWVIPYSYGNEFLDPDSVPSLIYTDFKKNGQFKGRYKIGNATYLVGYTANGEAADWMLSQGVIAISPELGEQVYSEFFNNFYPDKENTIKLFETEFVPLLHFVRYLPFQPTIEEINQLSLNQAKSFDQNLNDSQQIIQVLCKNPGVGTGEQNNMIISNNVQLLGAYYQILSFDSDFNKKNVNIQNLQKIDVKDNSLSSQHFLARSQIVYYFILQSEKSSQNQINIYFDLIQAEKNASTFTLVKTLEEEEGSYNRTYQHLYQLLYVGVAISLVLIILYTWDKKQRKRKENITELIDQKPEIIELKQL